MRFCVTLVFCLHLSSSCDISESGMGSTPLLFLGVLLVSVYLIFFISFDICHIFLLLCFSFSVCRFRCPCPCLHVWVVFLRLQGCLSCVACRGAFYVVAFYLVLLFVLLFAFYVSCSSRRCPLLATFLSVLFCPLSLTFSERIPGLIWFGSVYLVTTAGFKVDQLMWHKQEQQQR